MKDRRKRYDDYRYEDEEFDIEEQNSLINPNDFEEYQEHGRELQPYRRSQYTADNDYDYDDGDDYPEDGEFDDDDFERRPHRGKARYEGSQLLILLQLGVCVFILVVVFLLKVFGGNAFTAFQQWYNTELNKTVIATDGIKEYRDKLFASQESSQAGSSGEQNSDAGSSSSQNSAQESSQSPDKATSSEKSPVSNKELAAMSIVTTQNMYGASNVMLSVALSPPLEKGTVTSLFGFREDPFNEGAQEAHKGLDIGADEGTKIFAALPGKVTVAQKSDSYGNYVVIDHGNGISTLYAHCSKLLVKKGDEVLRGDTIGEVGSTGAAKGNHLHFELHIKDVCYDPRPLLRGLYNG